MKASAITLKLIRVGGRRPNGDVIWLEVLREQPSNQSASGSKKINVLSNSHQPYSNMQVSAKNSSERTRLQLADVVATRILPRTAAYAAGSLLLAAAAAKAHSLHVSEALLIDDLSLTTVGSILLIALEIFLGVGLLFSRREKLIWLAGVSIFTIFSVISFYSFMSGSSSCGCFGSFDVAPGLTLTLDILILSAMLLFPPLESLGFSIMLCRIARLASYTAVLLGMFSAFIVINMQAEGVGQAPLNLKNLQPNQIVKVEPKSWIGERLPLLNYINLDPEIAEGRWDLVFFRHDCMHCRASIPRYINQAIAGSDKRYAFVEAPPFEQISKNKIPILDEDGEFAVGRLSDLYRWQLVVPTKIAIQNGKVLDVRLGS